MLKKVGNDIRIQFKKTKAGFGGQFGYGSVSDMYTLMPTKRNATVKRALYLQNLFRTIMCLNSEIGMSVRDFDKKLYPVINWSDDENEKGSADSYVRYTYGQYAVGYTKVFC